MTTNESIAIVGLAFRFPGDLDTEESLWQALQEGRDLVGEVPADRWATKELKHKRRKEPGRSITFAAGICSRVDEFDAGFFGISPREAAWMDPQQRMLLELAWEALENAGQKPADIAGTNCAVYVGISSLDYGVRAMDDLASISPNYMTGNTLSIAANRLSYVFDLRGPSVSVDTACSSSLVALHHACNSLRTGESSSALVGGVSLLLHPYPFIGFTKASMLSEYGRCRAFDASGAGYVRGEGAAVLLLKPLSKAKADGDTIQGVILASGINADGAQKTGITIPNVQGQQVLMRSVLDRSGLDPADIDYIEAHGTGTSVGDPVETAAIGAVYGRERAFKAGQIALPIGSVKTNLGHMEAASGMAGLIKAILVSKYRAIPPTINCHTLNPKIDFSGLNLDVVREYRPISKNIDVPIRIGVNSFGFGGANAHIILESGEGRQNWSQCSDQDFISKLPPLFLSARSLGALNALANAYADIVEGLVDRPYYDIAYSAVTTRDWLPHRLAVTAGNRLELIKNLREIATGNSVSGSALEDSLSELGGIGFVYSGNGSQWHGMGRQLLAESPEYAEQFSALDIQMREAAGFSILEAIESNDPESIADTTIAQPLLFAIQVCVTDYLKSLGIKPMAVTGHSVGEVAAAWASGALSLAQAIQVVCVRSQAQGLTRGTGRMAAVALSSGEANALIHSTGTTVEIAGINSPNNVTLSGDLAGLQKIEKALQPNRTFFRLLDLDYAFHSRHMDPIRATLEEGLRSLAASKATDSAYVSTVTGTILDGAELNAEYWWRNIRQPVCFEQAIASMANLGCRVFLEVGPNVILQRYISDTLRANGVTGKTVPTLKRQADGTRDLTSAGLRAQLLAEPFDPWSYFPVPGNRVRLPNYPWQHERYWHPETSESQQLIQRVRVHPLLGWRINALQEADFVWENDLDTTVLPWLKDHNVGGSVVFPGACYVEMALAASREWLGHECLAIEELDIVAPLILDEGYSSQIRLDLNPRDGSISIRSRQRLSGKDWVLNAVGRIVEAGTIRVSPMLPEAIEQPTKVLSGNEHYALTETLGLVYGPSFRAIEQVVLSKDCICVQIKAPSVEDEAYRYLLPPNLLDQCFQCLVDFFESNIQNGDAVAYLPVKVEKLTCFSTEPINHIRGRLRKQSRRSILADFELFDAKDNLVAKATGCRFRAAPPLAKGVTDIGVWYERLQFAPRADQSTAPVYPPIKVLAGLVIDSLKEFTKTHNRHRWHNEQRPLIEALALAYLYEASQSLFVEEPEYAQQLFNHPENVASPLIRFAIQTLKEEDLLVASNGHWSLSQDGKVPTASAICIALLQDASTALPQILTLARVGNALPEVFANRLSLETLKAAIDQTTLADNLLDEAPNYVGTKFMLDQMIEQLVKALPDNHQLRVLIIGEGNLDLPQEANIKVAAVECRNWQEFSETTLAGNIYDLIIVRHALHQDVNPRATIGELFSSLSTGGLLLIAEQSANLAEDLVNGINLRWWRDAATSALNEASVWQQALEDVGFEVCEINESAAQSQRGVPYLLVAQKPVAEPVEENKPLESASHWLLLVDDASAEVAQEIAVQLQAKDQTVTVRQAGAIVDADKVVSFIGWDANQESTALVLSGLLATLQDAISVHDQSPQLTVVTSGMSKGAVSGMIRVAMNEAPQLGCKLIDLAVDLQDEQCIADLFKELTQPDEYNEVVLTRAGRYSPLVLPGSSDVPEQKTLSREIQRFRLDFTMPGQLRNLGWIDESAKTLGAHEIEVETKAVGLNFRDVMYTMGLLRDEAVENGFAGSSLGLEFAGVVKAVGADVHEFNPGQAVMGFGSACFASHVVTPASAVAVMPEGWSFEAAATVPTTFFTAYYALKHLANLQPGERVLIHGAAGGVGIAAIQLAQHLGAEIYATAGTEEKRAFVRMLGVEHIYDSRNLDFAELVLAETEGEGVDVVLNSLAGEAIRRNLQVLKPFGRFLELGKRDFFENTPIGLRPFKNNITYFGIDADQLLNGRPELANRLFSEVMALFNEGVLYPLPHRSFSAPRVVEAFRAMQQSRHIGKIVVSMGERPNIRLAKAKLGRIQLDNDSTWLITGGVSGFGLESAKWLASRGAGHLVLISRRGGDTPGATQAVEDLKVMGVTAEVVSYDITDETAVRNLIDHIQDVRPPIKGVLHAAAHFDDALITALTRERLNTVLAPKVQGAWNLHELTKDLGLDHFVLYSSITTVIGNVAQANYVAANMALEGLARLRHRQGLPAVAIGWGPIADAGYLTRNESVKNSLAQKLGKASLTASEALNQLDWILKTTESQIAIANFDWATLSRFLPSSTTPRFTELNKTLNQSASNQLTEDIQSLIQGKSEQEAEDIVGKLIIEELSHILSISADRIELTKSLYDLGMDSLMAVELALALEMRFRIQLPAMMLNDTPTVSGLSGRICRMLTGDNGNSDLQTTKSTQEIESMLKQHGETINKETLLV